MPLPPTPELLQRRKLETLIGAEDASAIAIAWPFLGHADRFLRFAARAVVEHRPASEWQQRVFAENEPRAAIQALVALARCGDKELQGRALEQWLGLDLTKLSDDERLEALRACSLLITRMGQPERATAQRITAKIDPFFPNADYRLNRDVASLLAVLGSPTVVSKLLEQMRKDESLPPDKSLERLITRNGGFGGAIAQMVASKPISQRMHYANALSVVERGWTHEQRKEYFTWLALAPLESKGGDSFQGFIRMIRDAAWKHVPEGERGDLVQDKLLGRAAARPLVVPGAEPKGPGREWTLDAAAALAQKGMRGRNFANGQAMYRAMQCAVCHRFAGEGASVGPDLSTVGGKFSARDLLESILEPSKVISDQYQASAVTTKDGSELFGRIQSRESGEIVISLSPFDASLVTRVKRADVAEIRPWEVSPMPPGLVNRLNEAELLDLVAYLLSGGNEKDKAFAK